LHCNCVLYKVKYFCSRCNIAMYFYTFVVSFSLFYPQNGRKLHTMTTTGGGTPCDLQQYNKYSNIIFSFVCALKAHTRKKINDIEELRPTGSAMLSDGVIYCAFYGFFVFVRAEKTKKRGSEGEGGGVMAGDAGGELEPGRGTAGGRRHGWRCAGGVPGGCCGPDGVACLVHFKSKYKCTPYLLPRADAIKYYFAPLENCTMPEGWQAVTLAGGLARHTPLSTLYVGTI